MAFIPQSYDVGFTTQKSTEVLAVPLPVTLGEERTEGVRVRQGKAWGNNAPQHIKTFLSGGNKFYSVASSRHK